MSSKTNIEEDINVVEALRKELGLSADGNKVKAGFAIENILADRERLKKENTRLSNYRYENGYCIENTNLTTKDKIASIQKNTYKIEIEDGVFVDVKELYVKANKYDSLVDGMEDKIEEIKADKLNYSEDDWYLESELKGYAINALQELLDTEK